MRFTNVPPSLHCRVAAGGASKTTMSPRCGSWNRYASRFAITRSEKLPSQPAAGAVHLRLGLADVRGEVALLLAEPLLEVGDLLLAELELVLADLEVGLEAGLARLDLGLALVDLAQPRMDGLLGLDEALLLALEPLAVGRRGRVDVAERRLPRRELLLAGIEGRGALLEVVPELGRCARALQRRLAPVELRLAGGERCVGRLALRGLPLSLDELLLPQRERGLALVELGDALERRLRPFVLAGRELLAEPVGRGRDLLFLRVELPLPLGELLVAAGELRLAPPELLLPVGERLVALVEDGRPRD